MEFEGNEIIFSASDAEEGSKAEISLADKTNILGQLWIEYRKDENFKRFFEYNDIGLPMAYQFAQGLIRELSPEGEKMINETFAMFLDVMEMQESDFEVLPDRNLGAVFVFSHMRRKFSKPN